MVSRGYARTVIKEHGSHRTHIHSADSYFVHRGVYTFDPHKISRAHKWNLRCFIKSLVINIPIVICDNTNTMKREYRRYEDAARAHGYDVEIRFFHHPSPEVAAQRNVHNVPIEKIVEMINRFEDDSQAIVM